MPESIEKNAATPVAGPPRSREWIKLLKTRRLANKREGWTHASSYRGASPAAFVHRARLKRLRSLIALLQLSSTGTFLDLGCSDGYIISQLVAGKDLPSEWSYVGFDYSARLIRAATERGIPGTSFAKQDLRRPEKMPVEIGDLTICLETLEHVGDLRAALRSIDVAIRPDGVLILSMPNEVGAIGLIKLFFRPLLRSAPYAELFSKKSEFWRYALRVACRRDISYARSAGRKSWGPHLGFDHRYARKVINELFEQQGRWVIVNEARSAFGSNHFLVVQTRSAIEPDADADVVSASEQSSVIT